jgi:hypothetical protein
MKKLETDDCLVDIIMVWDGDAVRRHPPYGNFLGFYGTPPAGGWRWYAINGDWGDCASAAEAEAELAAAWVR